MVVDILQKIVFVLGIVNLISLFLVLFSCRCMMGTIVSRLVRYNWYKKFYSFHGYYWWIFIISVLLHSVLAVIVYGNSS